MSRDGVVAPKKEDPAGVGNTVTVMTAAMTAATATVLRTPETTQTAVNVGDDATNQTSASGLHKSSHLPQYVAAGIACGVSVINGLSAGWASVVQPLLQSAEAPLSAGPLSDEAFSWLPALMFLPVVLALPLGNWLFTHCTRKLIGYVSGGLFFLHWLLLCTVSDVRALYAARALAGVSATLLFHFTPCYIREIAEDSIRGQIGSFMSNFYNAGVLLAYSAGGALSYEALNLLGLALCCLFFAGFLWLPESPVCLAERGRPAQAAEALRWLRGRRADVAAELKELEGAVKRAQAEDAASLRDVFADRASVKGLVLAGLLCANQPLCGFFVVLSYATNIFTEASPSISPHLASSIVGIQCVLGSVVSARLVDRLGRKVLFLASDCTMAVCLTVLGVYTYLKDVDGVDVAEFNWVPVVSLSIFMTAVTLAITTLPFVLITEMFLPQAQKFAINMSAVLILLLGFVATKFFSSIIHFMGLHSCYWFFASMCALISIYIFFELPETKGRSLESIREELAGGKKNIQVVMESKEVKDDYNDVWKTEI